MMALDIKRWDARRGRACHLAMARTMALAMAGMLLAWVVAGGTSLQAQAATPRPAGIEVAPREVALHSARAKQQLLVTGKFAAPHDGEETDLTPQARYESLTPSVALVTSSGVVVPVGFGRGEIVVKYATYEARVEVSVDGQADADPIDFRTETIAALSRAGCNSGPCHGSPQGKNGFRLSLRGFDPQVDIHTLTRNAPGRRVNVFSPDDSLILAKGLGRVAHQGGVRFQPTDPAFQILRTWIKQGCQVNDAEKKLLQLEVLPEQRRLQPENPRQQIVARAHFSDGSIRDVTNLAVFSSSDPEAASVTDDGQVEFHRTAETTILVRYLEMVRGVHLTYVDRDPRFKFVSPPPANEIDRHVFAKQRELQLVPAELCDDAAFVRRVYLDAIGVLPTAEEARRFLQSNDSQKRTKLIDELLERDEFASYWALKWADVMRGSEVTISQRGVHSFHRYLVKTFRDDTPFDQFARRSLTSLGNTLNEPAANFHRVARTPEDAAEAMSELFLGVRIGCAKCHNHPFEAMTQNDYYGLAAFFARVKFKGNQLGRDDETVYLDQRSEVRHPNTNQNVPPSLFGKTVEFADPAQDRRQALADWLANAENPYFARATVNRVWYHIFGQGIVEPVDDFRDTNPPSNSQLLDSLAQKFIASGFRLKSTVRSILNSHTYQLSSKPPAQQSAKAAVPDRYFTHAGVRMLSAEQSLDAISAAVGVPATFEGYPAGTKAMELADGAIEHPFLNAFSKPVRDVTCECAREDEPSLGRVIHLLNNPEILTNIASERSRVSRWLAAGKTDEELVDLLYLSSLSRHPSDDERALIATFLKDADDRAAAFHDLQHALLISNEFLLRH